MESAAVRVRRIPIAVVVAAVMTFAAPVLATPPAMTAVEFPITLASIAEAVATAGAALLIAYFGIKVGFSFVKKLMSRLNRSV